MAINFPEGTQNFPAKLIGVHTHTYNTIANFSGSNTSFENMFYFTHYTKKQNSVCKVQLEIAGFNSAGNADNNYRLGWRVGTTGLTGTFNYIGGNPNESSSGSGVCIHGNHRGSDWTTNSFVTEWTNVFTGGSSGHASWSAGDTLEFWVDRMGEGTFYINQGNSTGALRFGRGRSKIIIEEFVA